MGSDMMKIKWERDEKEGEIEKREVGGEVGGKRRKKRESVAEAVSFGGEEGTVSGGNLSVGLALVENFRIGIIITPVDNICLSMYSVLCISL